MIAPQSSSAVNARKAFLNPKNEFNSALRASKSALLGVALFSLVLNVVALTGSIFMLEVYDRVLPSHSVPTLVGLAIITGVLYASQGVLDVIRSRIMVRVGGSVDHDASGHVYNAIVRLPLSKADKGEGLQPLRDLESVRTFLSGMGPIALFDLPWMPIYLSVIFSFHVYLGFAALSGAILLVAITLLTEGMTKGPMRKATTFGTSRHALAETSRRNAEVLVAMGMAGNMRAIWAEANTSYLLLHQKVSDVSASLGGLSKIVRMALQSAVLAIGAYLVIQREATGGIMIAGSILTGRALAPIDLAVANWKGFVAFRQSWRRLKKHLEALSQDQVPLALPSPTENLRIEALSGAPPGAEKPVFLDFNFSLTRGQALGIVGPSASGKSSLARTLVGVWQPIRGKVRLDGAALDQWSSEALGSHIGYLPQDVELFPGTIAQNIARFHADVKPESIIAAAQAAGAHDLIVALGKGYDTRIGENGAGLSAGQQQRVALARALFGDPFLVVLDEPNSNLDFEGEQALAQAILGVRKRGGIVVLIAHRESALASVDHLLAIQGGRMQFLGPKEEVLARLRKPVRPLPQLEMA